MPRLAAFADEISPELSEQIRVCKANAVTHFELRGVAGKNVLDFDRDLRHLIREQLRANGLGVACIGSPIGKAKISDSWEAHFERFRIAVELAEFFASPLIRIFSYYPPEQDQDIRKYREEILQRMQAKVDYVKNRPITLVHENEKGIYGEHGPECLDLVRTINSPKLRCAFDFANFVQVGDRPLDNWPMLKPYVTHIHIKDARAGSGSITPPGEGDGQMEPILADAWKSGYQGFLTLEPHLKVAGHSHGETGEALFKVAADALKAMCQRNGIPLG